MSNRRRGRDSNETRDPNGRREPPGGGRGQRASTDVQQSLSRLTCHRDQNPATAVCGECGVPLCENHQAWSFWNLLPSVEKTRTVDATYTRFSSGFASLVGVVVALVAIPVLIVGFSPVHTVLGDFVDIPSGTETAILHSSLLVGLSLGLSLWSQGAESLTSVRFLRRRTTERVLCKNCHEALTIQRGVYLSTVALAGLFAALGLYWSVTGDSLTPLRVAGLGLGVYILRFDSTLYIIELMESDPGGR